MELKPILLLMILHGLVQGILCSSRSSLPSSDKFSQRKLENDSFCPLDFEEFGKIVARNPVALQFTDVPNECHSLLEAVRMIRSEYLRKT